MQIWSRAIFHILIQTRARSLISMQTKTKKMEKITYITYNSICIVRPLPFVLFSSYVVIFMNVKLYHRHHESFFVFFSTVILFFFIFPPSFFTVMEMKPKFLSSFCFISSCFFFVKTILQLTAYKCRAQFFHYLICKLISVL